MGPDVHGREVAAAAGASARRPLRERADPILAAVVFALFARAFLFQAFSVPTPSMERSVRTGDRLLVNKFIYSPPGGGVLSRLLPRRRPRRGDVVVFRFPGDPQRDFLKRVVALPGETVEIRDRTVYVDGRALPEPYVSHREGRVAAHPPDPEEAARRGETLSPRAVPAGTYFVLGDNRDDSSDSRAWGPVPEHLLVGRALLVYWSRPPRADGDTGAGFPPLDFLRRTRWERTFLPVR